MFISFIVQGTNNDFLSKEIEGCRLHITQLSNCYLINISITNYYGMMVPNIKEKLSKIYV